MPLSKIESAGLGTGAVLQVINATYGTTVTNATTTLADTGLSASITPKFASSKILVLVSENGILATANSVGVSFSLLRNSTELTSFMNYTAWQSQGSDFSASVCYVDNPSSTSAITYKTQFKKSAANAGTAYIQADNSVSAITLLEIAA